MLPSYKIIQQINSCSKDFSYRDPLLYDEGVRARTREGGYIDDQNIPTPKGLRALSGYAKRSPLFRELALDLLAQLKKSSSGHAVVPMCGYVLGYAKACGWIVEGGEGRVKCTGSGLAALANHLSGGNS